MKETILRSKSKEGLRMTVVELSRIKRGLRSNRKDLKWMNPFHRPFVDNTTLIQFQKQHIQYLIDLCKERIKQLHENH